MKLRHTFTAITAVLLLGSSALALPIPSDGSDGNFNPGSNIEIDLGQATYGQWDANNSANTGKGIYDPVKWAVVFKYASVNIPTGVTVTFKNNAAHAPVVWLVQGNVTINGTVSLVGSTGTNSTIPALVPTEPGPGGFRGGATGPSGAGAGYGPGGGANNGGTGQYQTSYGNPQILPLIGGSGSGQSVSTSGVGAGGAILVAASGNISLAGLINVNGGAAITGSAGGSVQASAGAVRLIAEQVLGAGEIRGTGITASAAGRIRIETSLLSTTLVINPNTIAIPPPATPVIWPASNAPTAQIVSVDNVLAPSDPTAPLLSSADVGIEKNTTVNVLIQTTNFPVAGGSVKVRINPKYGNFTTVTANYSSGNFASAFWTAGVTFVPGFTTLQTIATVP